jgi:hypothetical protein
LREPGELRQEGAMSDKPAPWKILESSISYRDQWLTLRSDRVVQMNMTRHWSGAPPAKTIML